MRTWFPSSVLREQFNSRNQRTPGKLFSMALVLLRFKTQRNFVRDRNISIWRKYLPEIPPKE